MDILPTSIGTRPRLACEIRPEGVVAARCEDGAVGVMVAVSRTALADGAFRPHLRAGNVVDRTAVVGAVRQTLEKVFDKNRELTLVVPDASVRVLLLDFDSLPSKPVEALPVVRFRLKKLLPFDADDAAVSYQVMSTGRGLLRVMAVAMPSDVLSEYESVVREAGFEPGAILPSTLAALAGLDESEAPVLLVNAGPEAVTTAIVKGGVLLLHRSVDMRVDLHVEARAEPQLPPPTIPAELLANPDQSFADLPMVSLPLVDRESTVQEWAMQEALPEYPVRVETSSAQTAVLERPLVEEELPSPLPPGEIVQAVSVAAAYFEDTLQDAPGTLLAAGVTSAERLTSLLRTSSLGEMTVRDVVDPTMMPAALPAGISRGWLAGVRGALRS